MIALLLFAATSFMDSTQVYYARQDVDALDAMLDQAETRFEELLCRYRLYPLTERKDYIDDLPEELEHASARELALLAGLWGYRAGHGSVFAAIRHGRRSQRLLDAAKAEDPDDPFVLLIEGQSLLFKPRFAGRDEAQALDRFNQLHALLDRTDADIGISKIEAALWRWYAMERLGTDRADAVREELLAADPPPLYRQFLQDPP